VKEYVKIPAFDGEEDEWNAWSDVFLSVMEQKGYDELVDCLDTVREIPKDDETYAAGSSAADLRYQNCKAFTYLLTAMRQGKGSI
jgi:hypothetical protein